MEKIVLFLFLNVFSSLADVWCFFKISRVRSKKRQILFLCIANIFLGSDFVKNRLFFIL